MKSNDSFAAGMQNRIAVTADPVCPDAGPKDAALTVPNSAAPASTYADRPCPTRPVRRSAAADAAACGALTPRRSRLRKRNRLVAARYYYWTELQRRREDDVRKILCDNEFFVEERTVANALLDQDEFLSSLIRRQTSRRELRRLFPGFDWR